MAFERYKRNTIPSLTTLDGSYIEDHDGKESIMFQSFKERFRTSSPHEMKFNIKNIIKKVEGLDQLTTRFIWEEIDEVMKEMPVDQDPGLEGFSSGFYKTYWPIINEDLYAMCSQFFEGKLNVETLTMVLSL